MLPADLAGGDTRGRSAPPPAPREPVASRRAGEAIRPLWMVEREAIEHAIECCGGNIPRAPGLLEVSPSTLYRKRQAWNQG